MPTSFQDLHSLFLDVDRFPFLLMAILLTAIVGMITGPAAGNANPFLWRMVDAVFGGIGGRLDRSERTGKDLLTRGLFFTFGVLVFAYILAGLAEGIAGAFPLKGLTEVIFLSLCLTSGTVWFALLRLYFALKENKVGKGAYYTIARSARTDLSTADDYTITRAGMGYAARAFDKGLVAPALWYMIFGLPGAFIYAALAALAWRFGKDGFSKGFGKAPMALERLMGFVPSVFSGFLLSFSGLFTPTAGMTRALLSQMQQHKKAPYAEGGVPVSALAYALNVSLGGPATDLDGSSLKRSWIGPKGSTAQLESGHLRRALYISFMAFLLFVCSVLSAMLWGHLLG